MTNPTNIVSSTLILNNLQTDGRSIIREQHVDDQGNYYYFDYIADAGFDPNIRLAARAQELNDQFANNAAAAQADAEVIATEQGA